MTNETEKLCKNCAWNVGCSCTNIGKIHEYKEDHSGCDDELEYSYYEGGYFNVGDNFGCIHFKPKPDGVNADED